MEAAARIRVRINQYFDNLMEHGADQRKELSKNGAIRSWAGEEVHYTDPGVDYRDAGNYVYACALQCALRDAPTTAAWWNNPKYGEEKAGDMIEIILGLAWMGKHNTRDHAEWREAVENRVRNTEKLTNLIQRTHHRYFAQRVKQALFRISKA